MEDRRKRIRRARFPNNYEAQVYDASQPDSLFEDPNFLQLVLEGNPDLTLQDLVRLCSVSQRWKRRCNEFGAWKKYFETMIPKSKQVLLLQAQDNKLLEEYLI